MELQGRNIGIKWQLSFKFRNKGLPFPYRVTRTISISIARRPYISHTKSNLPPVRERQFTDVRYYDPSIQAVQHHTIAIEAIQSQSFYGGPIMKATV